MNSDHDITVFSETNFRGVKRRFGIKRNDRRRHMYMIGKTGMGKTTLLENMTIQDIQSGEGVGIVDPHGEYAERMLDFVPPSRINDVVYFNPCDLDNPVAFNVMEDVGPERRHLVSAGLLGVFKKIWGAEVWSGRMEYLLSNAILALLETPGTTLLGINRIFADKEYRKQIVGNVTDPIVRAFWENEFAKYTDKFATEAAAAIQNKIGQFTSNPLIRNIIGQSKSSIDMRKIIDEKKIFIMNLSKGRIGEENAKLLGAMLITRLYLAAMTRIEIEESKRADFYLYVDEFQNFATESFASILSEARKYRLDLILAHQYVEQMSEEVRDAVFGNVGTMIAFRVGATDAELLEKEFSPEFLAKDFVNLGFASIYLRLMIDGVASRPFSASTLPPVKFQDRSYKDEVISASRKIYGRDKKIIDKEIIDWQGLTRSMGGVSGGALKRDEVLRQSQSFGHVAGNDAIGRDAVGASRSEFKPALSIPKDFVPRAYSGLPSESRIPDTTRFQRSYGAGKNQESPIPLASSEATGQARIMNQELPRETPFHRDEFRRPSVLPVSRVTTDGRQEVEVSKSNVRPRLFEQRSGENASREISQHSRDSAPQEDAVPQIRLYESRKDEFMGRTSDIRSSRTHANDMRATAPSSERSEASSVRLQPIHSREKRGLFQPDVKKTSEFISLSQLQRKNFSSRGDSSEGVSAEQKPAQKKTINFMELKKVLSESFTQKKINQVDEGGDGIVHDRTGMLKPRESHSADASKKTEPKVSQGNNRVLKPGERITFK